ncbi:MAG TPA: hypothetical protein VGK73_29050 [Polyangiaceae bacterium]
MSRAWLNPAGGIRYHARGFRYAERLWAPFRWHLGEWLYDWDPPEKKLVLVGPSAGWCIQPFFFERFDEVLCLEPDPLAHFLFRRRLARAPLDARPRLRFEATDQLLEDPSRFGALLEREGPAAVLFSNIVGQVRVLLGTADADEPAFTAVREAVQHALRGRSWASFHDRVSGDPEPDLPAVYVSDARLDDAEIIELFYPVLEGRPARAIDRRGRRELLDHLTADFFPPERPHCYFSWQLLPGQFHLVEATRSA